MEAVIAKAVDAGYRFVIILTGMTNSLRTQTQDRIESDLVERNKYGWHIRSNLHRKKLRATASNKLARPEIPTPPRQQCPRNLVTPGRRGALPKAPKALFDNPDLLRIRPFPPPTLVDNRENLDL